MNIKKLEKEARRAKKFPAHALILKYNSRISTTKLLLSLVNTGYYTSVTLLHGQNFELDNIKIRNQLFLKTLNRE